MFKRFAHDLENSFRMSFSLLLPCTFFVVCIEMINCRASSAAENAAQDICIPHTQTQGPWNCTYKDISLSKCETSGTKELAPGWKAVKSESDAFSVLAVQYSELGNAQEFARWLDCQGFRVSGIQNDNAARIHKLRAHFLRSEIEPFPLPFWSFSSWLGFKNSQAFELFMDEHGQVVRVEVNEHY